MESQATVTELRAAVDGLMSTTLAAMSSVEVTRLLAELEAQKRRLEAVDQLILAEVRERGIDGEYGRTDTPDLLVHLLRITPREAKARIERSLDLGPRRAISGEPLPPVFPAVAEAVTAGEISTGHVEVITSCLGRVGVIAPPGVESIAEHLLVEGARHEHPRQLAKTAQLLLARLDSDGLEPREAAIERNRGFTLAKNADGSSVPKGLLTAELTAWWETIFDSLAAPVPGAEPDDRSAQQRRHDALADAAVRLIRSGTLPAAGGAPVTVLARTSMTELTTGSGVAVTGHGEVVSISKLLAMTADAHIIPVICTDTGGIMAYGRERRLASKGQRLALAARDGGCCFPGCDRPVAWTEVHHVKDWVAGGNTNIDEMCLLCRYHHRHFAKYGWEAVMIDGVPHWLPPPWLDPDRRPRRNTAHHLTDFDFIVHDGALVG